MPYVEQHSFWQSKLVRVGVAILAALLAKGVVTAGMAEYRRASFDPDAEFEKVAARPEFAEYYTALRTLFPADYTKFKAAIISNMKPGVTADESFNHGQSQMKAFMAGKKSALGRLDHEGFEKYRTTQAVLIQVMKETSIQTCASFVMTGLLPTRTETLPLTAEILKASTVNLRLISQAEKYPSRAPLPDPTPAQLGSLVTEMKAVGADAGEMAVLMDGDKASASPLEQCNFGIHLYEALGRLPSKTQDVWMAYYLTA